MVWQVDLDLFSMECNELSTNVFLCVCGFDMTSGSPFDGIQCCFPVLLENMHGLSCTELACSFMELDFCVTMETFGHALLF